MAQWVAFLLRKQMIVGSNPGGRKSSFWSGGGLNFAALNSRRRAGTKLTEVDVRRCVKAAVRKGAGSNPTAATSNMARWRVYATKQHDDGRGQ